ncbi:hypothetical protein LZC95_05210 [Pendulispora brunnea]|uniref:Response regulatory domain-containing protein n=1 Tax=Pendulispora brunnea TaxID=2905690 RepID=A0ABZ2KFZ8_9BACT
MLRQSVASAADACSKRPAAERDAPIDARIFDGIAVAEASIGMPSRPENPALHVTIVSDNPETRDGLERYLRAAGIEVRSTAQLADASKLVPVRVAALVLFPDDFATDAVLASLAELRSRRPRMLPVLVTREPKPFQALPFLAGRAAPLIVPKPAWGSTILDAIRAHLDGGLGGPA